MALHLADQLFQGVCHIRAFPGPGDIPCCAAQFGALLHDDRIEPLIRQAEKYVYDMNYEVQIWYDSINGGQGFDFVKFAEACGAKGERVTDPNQLKAAFARAQASGGAYVIDVICERETDCSMGASIAAVREFE